MQDTHPLTFLGVLVAIGGWLFLLFGTGVNTGEYAIRSVYNVHLGTIAENVIHMGYAIAIAGVIANVGARIASDLPAKSDAVDALPTVAPAEANSSTQAPSATWDGVSASARAAAIRESQARDRGIVG